MQRAMCIWIPDWPLERLAVDRADLRGRTVVLYEASPQGGLKVVAATAALGRATDEAPNFVAGIYPGMPLAEAAALVAAQYSAGSTQGDTEPVLEAADPDADRLALEQLAEWCQRFGPIAGVEDATRPECLLVDVTGLAALFGGEPALVAEVIQAFSQRGLSVQAAVADTIGAAWAAVHAELWAPGCVGEQSWRHDCPPAEPAANNTEPGDNKADARRGQILPASEPLAVLAPLPIGYLRVADETVALLATLGITRIGQLATLPRSALLSRFGPELLRRMDQAMGLAPETITARHGAPLHAADFAFEAPMANREAIEHVLAQSVARVVEPLAQRRQGVLRLVCRLRYERAFEDGTDGDQRCSLAPAFTPRNQSFVFSIGLFRPSASPEYVQDLLRLRLENVRMTGPVTSVHVEASAVGLLELRQQALFDRETNDDQPQRLAGLVDRLSNRLGRGAVVQVALVPDAQPEYTCFDVPLAGSISSEPFGSARSSAGRRGNRHRQYDARAEPGTKGSPGATIGRNGKASPSQRSSKKNLAHVSRYGLLSFAADERPLALLPRPVPVEMAVASDGAPVRFRWSGRSYGIAHAWGPERIETGWWRTAEQQKARKTFVRRDYYRIETTTGARFWIFRQLGDCRWFLHGRFD